MTTTTHRLTRREERGRTAEDRAPKTYFTEVTPEMAEEWLKATNIRRLRAAKIEQFRRDMLAGKWRLTGQAIHFNLRGQLIDGFHRLTACVAAGCNFPSLIAENMPEESLGAIDRGSPRTFSDYLRWKGETDVAVLAAVIRMAYLWEHGYMDAYEWAFHTPTLEESTQWFEEHPEIRDAIHFAEALRKPPLFMLPSIAGAFWWKAHGRFPEETKRFFEQLREGANLEVGNPILAYRRLLANQRLEPGRTSQRQSLAELLKAFNFWRSGRGAKLINWRASQEKFPRLPEADE